MARPAPSSDVVSIDPRTDTVRTQAELDELMRRPTRRSAATTEKPAATPADKPKEEDL